MQKERITVTLDPSLIDRIDRIAQLRDISRSKLFETLLELGVDTEEENLEQLASPILGPIVQSIMDHPKLIAAIAQAIGQRLDPDELLRWQKTGPKIRRTRQRLSDERGRRHDVRPEPA